MTIIEPRKNHFLQSSLAALVGVLFLLVVASIYFYNLNVSLKYSINEQQKTIQQLQASNADLRNTMYQELDVRNLTAAVQKQNLIQDRNPDYVEYAMLAHQ
ncbi:MAG: hypothetical protein KGI60_01870 [Patescibacteria group bacterium]|nr:hypothetical protein [Patescibacteria group bacterium]